MTDIETWYDAEQAFDEMLDASYPSAVLPGSFGLATTSVRFESGLDYHGFLGDDFLTLDNFD